MAELFSSTDMALARRIEGGHAHSASASTRGLSIQDIADLAPRITVDPVAAHEFPAWVPITMHGFAGPDDVPEEQVASMASANPWPESFFGLWDASRCATAAMGIHAGLATLFGDATLAPSRGHGLQLALIRHRLQRAAQLGCDLAAASVLPGSVSHRNYERAGFQLVYARVMVSRPL